LDIPVGNKKQPFSIHFSKMEETCLTSGKTTKIERCSQTSDQDREYDSLAFENVNFISPHETLVATETFSNPIFKSTRQSIPESFSICVNTTRFLMYCSHSLRKCCVLHSAKGMKLH